MTSDPDPPHLPLRWFPAHWGVAILAIGGALAMQFAWPIILSREAVVSWWPYDALVVTFATGFLLASAWMHKEAARWRPNELVPRMWQLGQAVWCDLLIGCLAALNYLGGPETNMLRAGLWIVTPVLLVFGAASVLATSWALVDGVRRFTTDVPPAESPYGKPRGDIVRSIFAILLLVLLVAIELAEPHVKPWEVPVGEQSSPPVTSH